MSISYMVIMVDSRDFNYQREDFVHAINSSLDSEGTINTIHDISFSFHIS